MYPLVRLKRPRYKASIESDRNRSNACKKGPRAANRRFKMGCCQERCSSRAPNGVLAIHSVMIMLDPNPKKIPVFVLLLSKESLMRTLKLSVTLELQVSRV